jgi:hypothetical protein
LFDESALYTLFEVHDRYVRSTYTRYQDPVCRDSCVEFFVQPAAEHDGGYFNIETNCGGTLLLYYVEDPMPGADGREFSRFTIVPHDAGDLVQVHHNMSPIIEPEISTPTYWWLATRTPFRLFEEYCGKLKKGVEDAWRGNFYKCADQCSHPHWAAWADIGAELNFHQPRRFGKFAFSR